MRSNLPPVIFLMGPTASGKTDVAMAVYEQLPVDIISVDSALVYRGMDIGTAKPSAEELQKVPHQLIDICDPAEPYSAADFCEDAEQAIAQSIAAGRIPLLVGGTMMYFKALLEGLADMPESDPAVRAAILQEAEQQGWPALHAQLQLIDPEYAAQVHPNHSQRISRALEVYRCSAKTMSAWRAQQDPQRGLAHRFQVLQLALLPNDRADLHQRIEQRFQQMLAKGLVEEVQGLRNRGDLHLNLPSMRAVGYRQVWHYLDGHDNYQTMGDKGLAATRQLAKRQLTWLQAWPALRPFMVQKNMDQRTHQKIVELILNFLPTNSL